VFYGYFVYVRCLPADETKREPIIIRYELV
jgi:hypothetical protein